VTAAAARRQLLLVAAIALAALALLAVWGKTLAPAGWEPAVLAALALGADTWSNAVRAINMLGNPPVWAVVVLAIAVAMWFARGPAAAVLVALTLASDIAAFALKVAVGRERPDTAAAHQIFGVDSFSFPSGHVVRAVAFAAVMAWLLAPGPIRLRAALLAAAVAWLVMGYARVSLGVHWPTDTIGGALLGLAWFAITAAILAPTGGRRRDRRPAPEPLE
jgi:undecaprenyl-diphosphatase